LTRHAKETGAPCCFRGEWNELVVASVPISAVLVSSVLALFAAADLIPPGLAVVAD